jgi:hypothetical protein
VTDPRSYRIIAPPSEAYDRKTRPVNVTVRNHGMQAQLDPEPIPHELTPAQIARQLDARLASANLPEARELARILTADLFNGERVR